MNLLHKSTSSTVVMQDPLDDTCPGSDRLFRIMTKNRTVTIASTETQTVQDSLNMYLARHSQDVDLLCSVIFWQKRTIDYQALHTAFLLDSLSEEEFEQEAEKFTVHQKTYLQRKWPLLLNDLTHWLE